MTDKLDLRMRKDVANEVWRVFGLVSERISFTFDPTGITIRVSAMEEQDLDGPLFITALVEGYNKYIEMKIGGA